MMISDRDVVSVSVSRRSRDAFSQRLGLVSVSEKCRNVSVSSRTESQTSRSRASGSRLQVTIFSYIQSKLNDVFALKFSSITIVSQFPF